MGVMPHLANSRAGLISCGFDGDGQIAAIARVNELVVVTANTRDFRRFEGLELENCLRR